MASVQVQYKARVDVTEVPDLGIDGYTDPTIAASLGTTSLVTLDGSSTPSVDSLYSDELTCTGGTDTLDLDALDRGNLPNLSLNGKTPQVIFIKANSANNAGGVKIEAGATEGYPLFGHSAGEVTLFPGMEIVLYGNNKLAEVTSNTDDKIDYTGTSGDKINIVIVA